METGKICAITMVYRDHWALSRWYAHHGAQLGFENLYIICHGQDDRIRDLLPNANIWVIPRGNLDNFDRKRAEMIDGFFAGLSQIYDWVLRTDADELICFDPDRYASLTAAIKAQPGAPVLTALGFDVVEQAHDLALTEAPTLGQRRNISFSGHYSKAVAARRSIGFQLHGVRVAARKLAEFPFHMAPGLYLAHLKYAHTAALREATQVREEVATKATSGGPGAGWRDASEDARIFLKTFEEKPVLPWAEAERQAFDALSVKPSRLERFSVVKTRALKLPFRTVLPASFSDQG